MRDPKRIPKVLDALRVAWEKYPDWRLGQVVSNAMGPGPQDVFFPEDNEWINMFKEVANAS